MSTLRTDTLQTTDSSYSVNVNQVADRGVLTNTADPAKGAATIGRGTQVVSSIAALKLLLKTSVSKSALVTGYYADGDGGYGIFALDLADTTSADNGGTIIVAADGGRWKLVQDGRVSVKQFGAKGDGITNDTLAINKAVVTTSSLNKTLTVPNGTYILVPATSKIDEAGSNICAIEVFSNLHIEAVDGASFKIQDNYSTDGLPIRHSMFFTNQVVSNISILGLTMDMNGQNNKISPGRPVTFNNFTNAQFIVSGTQAGVAARASHVLIDNCKFINNAGVSCIVTQQSNTIGVVLSDDWLVTRSLFSEVGLDSSDHSSIYGVATNLRLIGNIFRNTLPQNPTTGVGGLVACELHASGAMFIGNEIVNYMQGLWVATNFTEALTSGYVISGNKARVSGTFVDFFSHNILPFGNPEGAIQNVNITGNEIEITADPVAIAVKSFLKLGARLQPTIVNFSNNVCRGFDMAKEIVLCLGIVGPNQLARADQITIRNNTCAGVTNGLVCFFGGDLGTAVGNNFGGITFQHNDLGVLIPSLLSGYPVADVYLYGPSAGVVERLRLHGLQTPTAPIVKDGAVGGRATIFGKAVVPVPIVWNGVTIGNGTQTSRVTIDTDNQFATVDANLTSGGTTTFSGPVYPTFTGLTADGGGAGTMTHTKTGVAELVPCFIDNTASFLSTLNAAGTAFGSAQTINGVSRLSASIRVPARSVTI